MSEAGEDLGVCPERVRERVARFDVVEYLLHRLLEQRILCLPGQDIQRLHQRKSRVDHRRELASEDHYVAGFHPLPVLQRQVLRLLAHRNRNKLLLSQVRDDVILAWQLDLGASNLTGHRTGAVVPNGHGYFSGPCLVCPTVTSRRRAPRALPSKTIKTGRRNPNVCHPSTVRRPVLVTCSPHKRSACLGYGSSDHSLELSLIGGHPHAFIACYLALDI